MNTRNPLANQSWRLPLGLPVREFVPNVIEPSFGIGRILYSLLEHSYWARADDVNRAVLSLPPTVAPIKCLIVPLSSNAEFKPLVSQVSQKLRSLGIASRVDDSNASIGKRYARNDELGTPFGVTLDFACEFSRTSLFEITTGSPTKPWSLT